MNHPLMTDLLSSIRSMPQVIQAATVYRPRVGRTSRGFLSATDAVAYEDGFMQYPALPVPCSGTPAATGWFDAEHEAMDRASHLRSAECDD
jgi:hypothetical protein